MSSQNLRMAQGIFCTLPSLKNNSVAMLRQAQHKCFDKLSTGISASSAQVLRQAQHRYFGKLSTGGYAIIYCLCTAQNLPWAIRHFSFDMTLVHFSENKAHS